MLVVDMKKYRVVWVGLSISGLCIIIAANNAIMLNSLVEYTGLISTDAAMSLFNFLNCNKILGVSLIEGINYVFKPVQRVFVILIPLLFFRKYYYKFIKNKSKRMPV